MLHNPEVESKNGLPTVSVIVLNYNGKRFLHDCFHSLVETLNYPKERLQLIMVDNGSSDGSVEYLEASFPEVEIICNSTNLGFATGNNIGAKEARGEYLAFLNNDTRVHPDWLMELVRSVSRGEGVVCAGGKILSWDGNKVDFVGGAMNFYGMGFQIDYGVPHDDRYSEEKEILFACGGSTLIRRDVFLSCGGFDDHFFAYYEDVDLGWRLWVLGYKVVFAPRSIAYHRHHGTPVPERNKYLLRQRNALYSMIKNYESETLARVLPVALLLLIERAYLMAEVDPSPYRLEPDSQAPFQYESPFTTHSFPHYWREVGRIWREEGLGPLWRKGLAEAGRRSRHSLARLRSNLLHILLSSDEEFVPKSALASIIAGSDLVHHYPDLLQERAEIQALRKRPDREIFRLFGLPFQVSHFDPRYEELQRKLARAFGLEELFGERYDPGANR